MGSMQRKGLVLILLVTGVVSSKGWAQEIPNSNSNSGQAGQSVALDYDGGTGLLKLQEIQKELMLSKEQLDSLRTIQKETLDQLRTFYDNLVNKSEDERRASLENIDQTMHEFGKKTLAKVKEVLQPAQLERLQQIKTQLQMRRNGGLVNSDVVSSLLNMTDFERGQLRENERQITQELREKIAQARREALQKLLDSITPEQRAKLDQLIGEPFEFPWGQEANAGQ